MNLNKLQTAPAQSALTPGLQKRAQDASAALDANPPGSRGRPAVEREARVVMDDLAKAATDALALGEFKKAFASPKKMYGGF